MSNKINIYKIIIVSLVLAMIIYDYNQANYTKRAFHYVVRPLFKTNDWEDGMTKVSIPSIYSKTDQDAYFYKVSGERPRPLVVSLHTWGGTYNERDPLSAICKENNINYIHPDFNGPNDKPESCCSELVIGQIDEAIEYAIQNSNVDLENIHLIGLSGGGYTAFCHYLQSNIKVASYQSWVGISDLESWYYQSISQENSIWKDILNCTESKDSLNFHEVKKRSPLHMPLSSKKSTIPILNIYTGIHDGIQGTVPITHSINFYNRMVSELYTDDSHRMVTTEETLYLLENRKALGKHGTIGNRDIYFKKTSPKVNLFIFEGEHEILPEHAILSILQTNQN